MFKVVISYTLAEVLGLCASCFAVGLALPLWFWLKPKEKERQAEPMKRATFITAD